MVIYQYRLKEFLLLAKGFAGSWNDIGISISQYSFLPINIYSVRYVVLCPTCSKNIGGIYYLGVCIGESKTFTENWDNNRHLLEFSWLIYSLNYIF